eukprot:g2856.t1
MTEKSENEAPTEDPSLDAATEVEESVQEMEVSLESTVEEKRRNPGDFRMQLIVGIAVVALSAAYVTIRRLFGGSRLSDGRHEGHPKKALVTKSWRPPPQKTRQSGMSLNNNFTFVVPEDFKTPFDEAMKLRECWRKALVFVSDTATLFDQLIRNGASFIGKAFTETTPLSVVESGRELFRNPEKTGTITGGEYSGCGVLVRSGLTDFAIAVDTAGGIRITAACCGIIGFKATYGCVPLAGICLKSDALDSAAFLVKDYRHLTRLGALMELPGNSNTRGVLVKIFLAKDLFDQWIENNGKEMVYAIGKAAITWANVEQVEEVDLGEFLSSHATGWQSFVSEGESIYEALRQIQNIIANYELKCKLLKDCSVLTEEPPEETESYHQALTVRQFIQEAFKQGIRENKVVIIPGLLSPPPSREASEQELKDFEIETQQLCALSTLVGCPQIYFPIHNKDGHTYSVSMMSLNKSDKELLSISEHLIPLTKRMLDAELLNEKHQCRNRTTTENVHIASDHGEFESEKWREIGNSCYKENKYEEAVVAYSEAINRCPHKAVYYNNRAMAHLKLGHYVFAEDDCTKAIGLDSNNVKALLRRGVARKALGKLIEAQEDLLEVLKLDPNNRQAKVELGDLERFFCRD